MTLIHVLRVPSRIFLVSCLTFLLMASTSQADTLYWDANGNSAGFGNGGTWGAGADAFWTTDSTGGFAGGGTATTTSADEVRINQSNISGFSMDVAGSVHAERISNLSPASPAQTIAGNGTINLYGSGGGTNDAVLRAVHNDYKLTTGADVGINVAAGSGSTVYLFRGGGNNGRLTFNGPITSTNSVDLRVNLILNAAINDSLNHFGTFTNDSGANSKNRGLTVSGVIGSNVTDVTHGGGNFMAFSNGNNAYTGDTFVNGTSSTSQLRINALGALPDTTSVFFSNSGSMALNFTGTNDISGLYFNGVEQLAGTWGAIGNGSTDFESSFFTGSGVLNVISAAPVPEPRAALMLVVGLLGLAAVRWRRR